VGRRPTGICAADIDGDGVMDFVTANNASNSVSIRTGSRRSSPPPITPITPSQPFAFSVFLPLFPNLIEAAVATAPSKVAVADMNADGIMDIVTLSSGFGQYTILLGEVGSLRSRQYFFTGRVNGTSPVQNPTDFVLADFTGDRLMDMAIVGTQAATLGMPATRAIAVSGFVSGRTPVLLRLIPTGTSAAIALAAGDVDGNGTMDLVSADANGNLTTRLGNRNAMGSMLSAMSVTFGEAQNFRLPEPATALALVDWNDDGSIDAFTASTTGRTVTLMQNRRNASRAVFAGEPSLEKSVIEPFVQSSAMPFSIVTCSPNPANDALTVRYELTEESTTTCEIMDVLQRVRREAGVQELFVSTAHLASGVYRVRLTMRSTSGGVRVGMAQVQVLR
jgi:large repetitive protein